MLGIRNKKLGVSSFLSFYSFLSSVFNHFTEIQKNYPFFFKVQFQVLKGELYDNATS